MKGIWLGLLLVVLGLVCVVVSISLVIAGGSAYAPVTIGGLAGAALAAGLIDLFAPIEVYGERFNERTT